MKSWKTFYSLINPKCKKRYFNKSEYKRISRDALRVNSTDLYDYYLSLGGTFTYQEFYAHLKGVLYYDKYICKHGVEFVYYIITPQTFPTPHFSDVVRIIKAVGGYNVQRYSKRD